MGESDLQEYAVIKKIVLNFYFCGLKQSLNLRSQIVSV